MQTVLMNYKTTKQDWLLAILVSIPVAICLEYAICIIWGAC